MYEEWNAEFERVGRSSLEAEALAYFRKELDDRAIQMDTRVFRKKPDGEQLAIFNKMAVKVFLSHIWEHVRELYPCLPSFVNVIGDADLMYTMSYPWSHVDTAEIHGVETVREFVDFAQGLMRKTCVRDAKPIPVSAARLGRSATEMVALTTTGTTGSLRDAILPKTTRTVVMDPGAQRALERSEQSKKALEKKYGYLTVNFGSDRPEIQAFVDGQKALEMLRERGFEATDATRWNLLSNILQWQGLTLYGEIRDGEDNPFTYQWAREGYDDLNLSPEDQKMVEDNVNAIMKAIKEDGTLVSIEGWVKDNSYGKYPSTLRIEGDIGDGPEGKFSTRTVIYTIGEKVVVVDFKRIYEHLRVRSGQGIESLWNADLELSDLFSEEDVREARKILGTQINFSSPNSDPEKVKEQAYALVDALFGAGTDLLGEKDVTVAVFLDAQSERENPGMTSGVEDLFGRLIHTKKRLRQASVKNKCETLLKRLDVMLQVRKEVDGERDSSVDSCVGDEHDNRCLAVEDSFSAEALRELQDEAFTQLEEMFAAPLFEAIDQYAVEYVDGWRQFKQARDSASLTDRANAAAAVSAAKALRQDGVFPDVIFAGLQRSMQQGVRSNFPLGVSNFGNIIASVGESMPDDKTKEFFYKNLSAELLKSHAREIAGTEMADIISWCNDVAFLYDVKIGRWQKRALHRNEQGMAMHTLVYCLAAAVMSLMVNLLSGDADDVDDKKKRGAHVIMICIGLGTVLPLAIVHTILFVLLMSCASVLAETLRRAGELPGQLYNLPLTVYVAIVHKIEDWRGTTPFPPHLEALINGGDGGDEGQQEGPPSPPPSKKGTRRAPARGRGAKSREAKSLGGDGASIATNRPARKTTTQQNSRWQPGEQPKQPGKQP